jgi:hypothetical protein
LLFKLGWWGFTNSKQRATATDSFIKNQLTLMVWLSSSHTDCKSIFIERGSCGFEVEELWKSLVLNSALRNHLDMKPGVALQGWNWDLQRSLQVKVKCFLWAPFIQKAHYLKAPANKAAKIQIFIQNPKLLGLSSNSCWVEDSSTVMLLGSLTVWSFSNPDVNWEQGLHALIFPMCLCVIHLRLYDYF